MLMNMAQALNSALDVMLSKDDKVVVFGEDVGVMGGVFLITEGLMEKYGNMRVFDTPISEAGIVGMAIGLAMGGYKPVVEIQFSGFSYLAFNQIISHLSRWKYRSLGRFKMSVVVRMPNGGGVRGPELHSESIENYMLATPGLKVVYPSNPYDAKGLLISSIEDEDPVIFLEHIKLYRYEKLDVPEGYYKEEIGKAKIVQEGNDLSIITYGYGVVIAKEFAKKSNLSIEIVDLRTIAPMDKETILKSVKKTGRAVIISENHKTLSVASEISAIISEEAIEYLIAPIERVCSMDIPYPPSTLEDEYLPNEEKLKRAVDRVMSYD